METPNKTKPLEQMGNSQYSIANISVVFGTAKKGSVDAVQSFQSKTTIGDVVLNVTCSPNGTFIVPENTDDITEIVYQVVQNGGLAYNSNAFKNRILRISTINHFDGNNKWIYSSAVVLVQQDQKEIKQTLSLLMNRFEGGEIQNKIKLKKKFKGKMVSVYIDKSLSKCKETGKVSQAMRDIVNTFKDII